MENVSEAHAKTCRDLQQLLADQRKTGDKWKEESNSIKSHYESALNDTRAQLTRMTTRCEDLEEQINRIQLQKRELLHAMTEEKKNTSRNFQLLQHAEAKADAATRQIQHLLLRENEILQDKKNLGKFPSRKLIVRARIG